jgi:hypothetical protein
MMTWFEEYKRSLKNLSAEEPLDVFFFRPIAFIVVKIFYNFPVTPNHYSILALIAGLLSSYCFTLGTNGNFFWGGILFLIFAVLDCADGMVARLKKNGSPYGRLVDGFVDYTVNASVYFSLAYGIQNSTEHYSGFFTPATLVILAGVSKAIHSICYDHYLTEFLAYSGGKLGFVQNELESLKDKIKNAENTKSSLIKIYALKIYLFYTSMQAGNKHENSVYDPKEYCQKNLLTLKLWGVIGPAVHILFLILAMLFGNLYLLFYYAIIFANVWLVLMLLFQFKINSEMKFSKVEYK